MRSFACFISLVVLLVNVASFTPSRSASKAKLSLQHDTLRSRLFMVATEPPFTPAPFPEEYPPKKKKMDALRKAADEYSNIISTNEIFGLSWNEDDDKALPEQISDENKMRLLMEEAPIEEVELESLKKEWKAIITRIESLSSTPLTAEDKQFSYSKIAPYLLSDSKVKVVKDHTQESHEPTQTEIVYITEQELLRTWSEQSTHALGKKEAAYSTTEALLLLDTDYEEDLMIEVGTLHDPDANDKVTPILEGNILDNIEDIDISKLKTDLEDFSFDELEYTITQGELQHQWGDRGEIEWGMPSPNYSDELALLLLDEDDDDDHSVYTYLDDTGNAIDGPLLEELMTQPDEDNHDGNEEDEGDDEPFDVDKVLAELTGEPNMDGSDGDMDGDLLSEEQNIDIDDVGIALGSEEEEEEEEDKPPSEGGSTEIIPGAQYTGRENQLLRESLYRMHKDLEELQFMRPPWRKERYA